MTMQEFKEQLVKELPTPETVAQATLLKYAEQIKSQLLGKGGHAYVLCCREDGSEKILRDTFKNLEKMFTDLGYLVQLETYSVNNKYHQRYALSVWAA